MHKQHLRLSSVTRYNLLHNVFGISEEELRSAEEKQKLAKQSGKSGKLSSKGASKLKKMKKKVRKFINAENFIKGLSMAASHGMMLSASQ